jgi:hypothetical protein
MVPKDPGKEKGSHDCAVGVALGRSKHLVGLVGHLACSVAHSRGRGGTPLRATGPLGPIFTNITGDQVPGHRYSEWRPLEL